MNPNRRSFLAFLGAAPRAEAGLWFEPAVVRPRCPEWHRELSLKAAAHKARRNAEKAGLRVTSEPRHDDRWRRATIDGREREINYAIVGTFGVQPLNRPRGEVR